MKGRIGGPGSRERRPAMAKTEGERKVYLAEVIEAGEQGQPLRVRVTGEAPDDVAGQAYRWGISQGEGDVEGQGYRWGLGRTEEDVEGHGYRWLRPEGEDTEGEGYRWGL
jgi:hypothetical protein